ncbi:T9SS type B sorting domain-containing protein [Hymenobacter tenuis]
MKFLLWFCLLLGLLAALPAAASHLMGGEITYRYLDNNGAGRTPFRYEVTVVHYINKNSAIPNGSASVLINFYDKAINSSAIATETAPRISLVDVNPAIGSGCALPNSSAVFVALAKYRTVVSLPASAAGFFAVCNITARNAGITNIFSSSRYSMTLFSEMAPTALPNTSPVFPDTAVVFICRGDTSLILNNAYDADGDRLSYSFSTPYGVQGSAPDDDSYPFTALPYTNGYSVLQPFGVGGRAQIDPATGVSRYYSPLSGAFVVAVDVKEYRTVNGQEVLLGTTRRDVQLLTRVCEPNGAPTLTATTGNVRNLTVVEGQRLEFGVSATDPEGLPLTLRASSVLLDGPGRYAATCNNNPGVVPVGSGVGVVSVSGTALVTAQFRFDARCGDARPVPYDVLITGTDENCNKKTGATVFRITVVPLTITGSPFYCPEGASALLYTVNGPPGEAYQWSVAAGTIVQGQGTNTVQVSLPPGASNTVLSVAQTGGCSASFTLQPDNAQVQLQVASVDTSDRSITLSLAVPNNAVNVSQVRVLRRAAGSTGPFATVGTAANTATTFLDTGLDADASAYHYRLELLNACGTVLSSQQHTTILTKATATEAPDTRVPGTVQVSWSAYEGFVVQQYRISRVADTGPPEIVATVSGTTLSAVLPSGPAGFGQCFRVEAVSTDATPRTSRSNDACVSFENKLGFYNIITPNGDRKNDVLTIDNVRLYPSNTLAIYNRYGKQVYHTRNYQNTFGGEGCAPGMYFYLFTLDNGSSYKGWFEIAR